MRWICGARVWFKEWGGGKSRVRHSLMCRGRFTISNRSRHMGRGSLKCRGAGCVELEEV